MANYQWDAEDYAKNSSNQQRWARELIQKLDLAGSERVLDVGCGDGKVSAEIAAHLPQGAVVGVDVSDAMIALAQQRFGAASHPNLRFQKEDAGRLPFSNEFDVVFSNATLHWVLDHPPVVRGIANSLKPGGKVLLQMGGKGNIADMLNVVNPLIAAPRWARYFENFGFPYGFYAPQDYAAWLPAAGLKAVRLELFPKDMVHAGWAGLAGWVRTTKIPYTQRVPEAEREAFIGEVVDAYLAQFPLDAQGNAHVRMLRLEVEAVKPLPAAV